MTTVPSRPDNSFFDEFLDDFYAECAEHLAVIRRDLLLLETSAAEPRVDRALLEELFRSFHSLKGLSGMVGLVDAEALAHEIESYFRALRDDEVRLRADTFDVLFQGVQALEQVLAAAREKTPAPVIAAELDALAALVPAALVPAASAAPAAAAPVAAVAPAAVAPDLAVWRFEFLPSPELAERGVNVNSVRARLEALGPIHAAKPLIRPGGGIAFEFVVATAAPAADFALWSQDGLRWMREELREAEVSAPEPGPAVRSGTLAPANLVRVDLARLDGLMQLIGDLVITRSRLDNQLAPLEEQLGPDTWRELHDLTAVFGRQLRDLREGVVRARMVPIGDVFARMQFVVRDLARELGRQVRLELSGQHTEIDKYIVERIADPLLHLVRNAVGHGLESAAERVAGGKPPEGLIMLSATTVGDAVTVELADDGRGVDVAAVAASARARGLPVPEGPLDDAQLLEILCAPGFSTREAADRISGRGVGMDVVWQTVHELGGTLSLTTAVGSGTRFRLQLPLTLTIVDALVVVAGGERFAIPLPAVAEAIAFGAADITVLERNELLRYRDDVLPLLRLSRVFGLPSAVAGGYALILRHGGQTLAVAVDRLREKREIVVRAIRDPLLSVVGVGGATELGDGRVVLILDPPGLAQLARKTSLRAARGQIAPDGRTHVMAAPPVVTDSYILFELAGATYGIRSADVLHIDMVEYVTPVPNASPAVDGVVLVRGQLVPLLNLRTRFGFPRQPHDLRTRVIVIQHGARQVGLLVDAAREFVRIAADAFRPPPAAIAELSGDYLAAIATLGERLVLLLKLDEVLTLTNGLEPPVQPTQT